MKRTLTESHRGEKDGSGGGNDDNNSHLNKKPAAVAVAASAAPTSTSTGGTLLLSLSDEILGNVFRFLNFKDGPLQLSETCHRLSRMNGSILIHNSCGVDNDLLVGAVLKGNRRAEEVLRNDPRITDPIPNCGHCDHTDRHATIKCFCGRPDHNATYFCSECERKVKYCQSCREHRELKGGGFFK
jgi:hypothetical protein